MKFIHRFFPLLGAIFLLFIPSICYSQNQRKIDSLEYEIVKFEAHKKELGANASKLLDTIKINLINNITTELFRSNPPEAMDGANELLVLSKEINYNWGISQGNNILGAIYDYKGDYKKAIAHYQKSLEIKRDAKDELGMVDLYINIGVLYTKQYDYSRALSHLYKALEIAKRLKDSYGIFGAYNNIGVLYKSQNKFDEAIKNYIKCLKLQTSMKDEYYISITYQNIGEAYLSLNNLDKALFYFEKGTYVARKSQNKESEANNYDGLGKILIEKGEYEKAYQSFEIALKKRQEIQDILGEGYSYMHLADLYYKQAALEKSLRSIKKALVILEKFGEISAISHGYELMAKIYDRKGNYKLAYENNLHFQLLNDSIFNRERDKELAEIQLQHNAKSIRDSLHSIQDKKDIIQREEARIAKNTTNYIYLVLSVILVFLIIVLVQRNKIETIKRQKALEQERNRISRNLHDDLGAQLSAVRMFLSSIKNQKDKNRIQETVDNSLGLLDSSIHELRNIMNDIHSSVLQEKGYLVATEILVNKINQLHLIQFSLSHHNMDTRFDPEIEHELYRVTQELINNTLKYAHAQNVFIEVLKRDGKLFFMYEDDGKGYDLDTIKRGNGLNNIELRIKSVGGNVAFDTAPSKGARTIIEIPL